MTFSVATARAKLINLRMARLKQREAEAEQFAMVAAWADEYRWVPDDGPVIEGTERLVQWGGEGTPAVAEFCTLELAAGLEMSELSARLWLRDALAIRGRFPAVWAAVADLALPVWQAREIAALTLDLTLAQCGELDQELAHVREGLGWRRLEQLVKARVLAMRSDEAEDEYQRRRAGRHVTMGESWLGATDVAARLDAADGVFLNAQLNRLASILGQGGNAESHEVRRAQALGVLASPAFALQLLQASLLDDLPELDGDCPARGQRGHTCGQVSVAPEALLPTAELVVHLTDESVGSGEGLARTEGVGPILTRWLGDLLGHTRVMVRPVLDPERLVASDAYECPPLMKEWVRLRQPHEAFPYSTRSARHCDLDHTVAYRPGVPGQTHPGNLAPLSRKAHRAKTHGGWRSTQIEPGVVVMTSPLGFRFVVSPSGTQRVEETQAA